MTMKIVARIFTVDHFHRVISIMQCPFVMCTNLVHTGGFSISTIWRSDLSLFYLFASFKIPSILHKLGISYAKTD